MCFPLTCILAASSAFQMLQHWAQAMRVTLSLSPGTNPGFCSLVSTQKPEGSVKSKVGLTYLLLRLHSGSRLARNKPVF